MFLLFLLTFKHSLVLRQADSVGQTLHACAESEFHFDCGQSVSDSVRPLSSDSIS